MQELFTKENKNHRVGLFLLISILVLLLDQISKYLVNKNLMHAQPVRILGDYLRLNLVYNTGLVWGIPFRNHFSYYILPIVGVGLVFYLGFNASKTFWAFVYGLIIGGALGNLIDRLRLGYVIDFIDMGIKNLRWPTYNIADCALVVSLILIAVKTFFR
jgi:signal peptidase II